MRSEKANYGDKINIPDGKTSIMWENADGALAAIHTIRKSPASVIGTRVMSVFDSRFRRLLFRRLCKWEKTAFVYVRRTPTLRQTQKPQARARALTQKRERRKLHEQSRASYMHKTEKRKKTRKQPISAASMLYGCGRCTLSMLRKFETKSAI